MICINTHLLINCRVRLSAQRERFADVMKRINMAGGRLKARACTAAVGGVLGSSCTSTRLDRLETRVQYPVDSR